MSSITEILETLRGYAPDAEIQPVMQAYLIAAQAHHGQTRKSGEAYLTHPIAVAQILANMRMDVDTIATALLHDALEDNPITKAELESQVGPVITCLVDGVTKIGKLKFRSKEELQAENFRKMMLAMSKDLRVILVKLADRLHNMRTLEGHKPEKRVKISKETMEVYVPIANRLGITHIKAELEDLCFKYMEPMAYEGIQAYLDETTADREAFVEEVCEALRKVMHEIGVEGEVSGRAKASASIWRKMTSQNLRVDEVQDLLAFRMLVADVGGCYAMLGSVHGRWAPVPGRIKDYIARPKANGYQSLHTTVIGPRDRRVEVQIRTEEMHSVAERGIAAHWQYKEGHLALAPEDVLRISRMRELFETAKDVEDASEFMETVKVAFYSDEVFVFTPAGEVKSFPMGATPLDFAFSVHTDIGERCTGARVDGRLVGLDYKLQSGQTIEIVTHPKQRPSRDWLHIARTSRAVSKIRRYLRAAELERAVELGRDLLESELQRFEWTLSKARSEGRLEEYVKQRNVRSIEPIFAELAHGNQVVADVAKAVLPKGVWYSRQEEAQRNRISTMFNRFTGRRARSPVLITGEDGLLVSYAGCCNPLPGEEVTGFITRGRGITVHRADCGTLANLEEDRRVPVQWDLETNARHSNTLAIHCEDRPGVLASITKACEHAKVNIEKAEARSLGKERGVVTLQLAVKDLSELTRVIRNVEKIPGVEQVRRVVG